MNNGIYVDSTGMREKGVSTEDRTVELQAQIKDLTSNQDNLMKIWKGPAAETFNEAVNEQLVNLNEFETLLHEMAVKIIEGANTFNQTEEENIGAVGNLF